MAINYLAKLVEDQSTAAVKSLAIGSTVPAGSLIILGLAAKRSSGSPSILSVTDAQGHIYQVEQLAISTEVVAVAWTKTTSPLLSGETITVTRNATLTDGWITAHAFDNASGTETDVDSRYAMDTAPQLTLSVSGSDWLTFAAVYMGAYLSKTITPVNSSLSRDSQTDRAAEVFSRNGTTGTEHTIGGTVTSNTVYLMIGVSFPFEAAGGYNARYQPTLIGV